MTAAGDDPGDAERGPDGPVDPRPAPLFSVVVTTRDRPRLLAEALASVAAQTESDFECVVVDDVSHPPVDLPATVAADDRFRLVRRDEAGGPAAARNTGVAAATGRYLTFLDDDDRFSPDRLTLALAGLAVAPVGLCWARYLDEPPRPKRRLDGDVADTILDAVTPPVGAMAMARTDVPAFDERYPASEDLDWWLRVTARHRVATVPEFGYLVRRHAGPRTTTGPANRIAGSRRLLAEHADWFATHRRAAAFRWYRIGLTAAGAGDRTTALDALRRSVRVRPSPGALRQLARLLAGGRPGRGAQATTEGG